MKELEDVLRARDDADREGKRAVLATIVRTSGSTYRRPGARMLLVEQGAAVGMLSGGCLEPDLARHAETVLAAGETRTVDYDMTEREDLLWGLGLGCAGTVRVLLEPTADAEAARYLAFVARCLGEGKRGAAAVLFDGGEPQTAPPGRRMLLSPAGDPEGGVGDPALDGIVLERLREVLRSGGTRVVRESGGVELLLEPIEPRPPLVLFGAGPDAVPVARLASELGWRVTIVDHRPAFVAPERFPAGCEVILSAPEAVPHKVALGERTAAIVMTHKFLHDVELARVLVSSPVGYLGFLGPRARTERLLRDAFAGADRPPRERLERVHGPVGLDIGAETPEEIALSALAEVHAVVSGRRGGFLRSREGPLHERTR